MEIKCPKCRFRYDTKAPLGKSEIACVCPRCGTPFTYILPKDEALQAKHTEDVSAMLHDEETLRDGREPVATAVTAHKGNEIHDEIAGYNADMRSGYLNESAKERQHVAPPPLLHVPSGHNRGCLKGFLLVLVSIVFAIILAFNTCKSSGGIDEIQTEHVVQSSSVGSSERDESMRIEEDTAGSSDGYEEVHPEPIPDWIQGRWIYDTSYGRIVLTIKGKYISETLDGRTSNGTFYYQQGKLHCDFKDSTETIYLVDEAAKQIDAGDGMYMTKQK